MYIVLAFLVYNAHADDWSFDQSFAVPPLVTIYILFVICPILYHVFPLKYFIRRSAYFQRLFLKDNIVDYREYKDNFSKERLI